MPAGVVHADSRPVACLGLYVTRQADAIEILIRNTLAGSPPTPGRDCRRIKANMLVLVMMIQTLWLRRLPALWALKNTPTHIQPAQKAIYLIANLHSFRLAPIHAPLPPPQS